MVNCGMFWLGLLQVMKLSIGDFMKNKVFGTVLTLLLTGSVYSAPSGSCSFSGMCIEFVKGYTQSEAQNKCNSIGFGTYQTSNCPGTNRIARCDTTMPGGSVFSTTFYAPNWSYDVVAERCRKMNGKLY